MRSTSISKNIWCIIKIKKSIKLHIQVVPAQGLGSLEQIFQNWLSQPAEIHLREVQYLYIKNEWRILKTEKVVFFAFFPKLERWWQISVQLPYCFLPGHLYKSLILILVGLISHITDQQCSPPLFIASLSFVYSVRVPP